MTRVSPIILLVIVILAIAFFALGLIQLLIRCLIKRPSFSLNSHSNRLHDHASSNPHIFQSQLQHLFRLHDSGLDRVLIDALPVFYYKDVMGSKEPFDCAVCLCEFSSVDKLKFLPGCSHAFHIHCIETWLLSNSTCPLCRSLIGNNSGIGECNLSCHGGASESFSQENAGSARVFPVRLGKFKNSNQGLDREDKTRIGVVSSSSSSIDARRCYSMGAFRYVVDDVDLQVALFSGAKERGTIEQCSSHSNTEIEGQKINPRSKGDSFSISKIWLWSKKGKFSVFSDGSESFVRAMPNTSNLV